LIGADNTPILPAALVQAFEALRDGALILDQQYRVLALNAAARRLFGRPGTQTLGQPVDVVLAGLDALLAALHAQPAGPVLVSLGAGAALARYELTLTPLVDAGDAPLGLLITLRPETQPPATPPDNHDATLWHLGAPADTRPSEPAALWRAVGFAAQQFLINTPSGQSLHAALAELGQATHASRVYVYEYLPNLGAASLTDLQHEWLSPQAAATHRATREPALPLGASGLSRWQELLSAGKPLHGRTVDFPEAEQEFLAEGAVSAILLLPIFAGTAWWGVLGFEDHDAARAWHPAELAALQATAAILGAALQLRRTFAALRESEARSRALVNAMPDTLLRMTLAGKILDFKSRDAFGQEISPETMIGRLADTWLPPPAMTLLPNALAQATASQQPQTFEYTVPAAGQADQHFEARLVIGGPDEVVLIIRDVSERARLEQMKSDFIHRAAHDLRTPLTTASLAASIIQEGGTPEELEQYWKILRNELSRQRELIEELLTLGRLESGTFQLAPGALEVAPFLGEAVESVRPLAEKRRVRLTSTVDPDLPRIEGDRNGLLQVLINLLDNAIKFSPPGTTVELEAVARADGVCLRVHDQGIGIPAADIPHLFTRFFRAGNAIRNEVQGTGVGLFIAKAIVDQLNGHISIESELDAGTTFEVWLPRHAEEAPR
jgi:two-component system, sensor histidine kinase and response regulator